MLNFNDLNIGQYVWTCTWDNRRSIPDASHDPSDYTLGHGEIVWKGETGVVLRNTSSYGTDEWFHAKHATFLADGTAVEQYFRQRAGVNLDGAYGELANRLDTLAVTNPRWTTFLVFCSLHGGYDIEEICFDCNKKAGRYSNKVRHFRDKLQNLQQLGFYTFSEPRKNEIDVLLNNVLQAINNKVP